MEPGQVVRFLKTESHQEGAFQCDNNVFREIVNRHLRDMRRSGIPAQILVIQLSGEGLPQEKHSLRAGDPFTRKGMELFLALLPGASGDNGKTVEDRIMGRYHTDYPKSEGRFDIQILDLGHMGQEWDG